MESALKTEIIYWYLIKTSALNVFRNYKKSIMMVISLSLGITGLLLITSYVHRINHAVEVKTVFLDAKGHLAIIKKKSLQNLGTSFKKNLLKNEDLTAISSYLKTVPHVFYSKIITAEGFINSSSNTVGFFALGVEFSKIQSIFNNINVKLHIPDWVDRSEPFLKNIDLKNNPISITPFMKDNLKINLGDDIQIISQDVENSLAVIEAQVASTHTTGMELKDTAHLIGSYESISNLLQTDKMKYLAIFCKTSCDITKLQHKIQKLIDTNSLNLEVKTFEDKLWNPYYHGTRSFLYFVGGFFSLLVILSSGLAILSFNYLNFEERKNEIGLLRSIGYTKKQTLFYFVGESFLISSFSLACGLILGLNLVSYINSLQITFTPPGLSKEIFFQLETSGPSLLFICMLYLTFSVFISFFVALKHLKSELNALLNNCGV